MFSIKELIDGLLDSEIDDEEIIKEVFFVHPTKNMEISVFTEIATKISKHYNLNFRDVKVIGSCHTGFSFVKPFNSKEVKIYNKKDSDVDVAIISKDLFHNIYLKTIEDTKRFNDNTKFSNAYNAKIFKDNLLKGYIRPDTIGSEEFRIKWLRFFKDLSDEYKMKISGAVYISELTFYYKVKEALEKYIKKREGVKDGTE